MEDVSLDELRAQFNQEIQTLTLYVFVLKPTFLSHCVHSAKVPLYQCNLHIGISAFVMSNVGSFVQQFLDFQHF